MDAAVFHEPGGPEKLSIGQFPEPSPGPGEIAVRVRACGINHLDLWVISGLPAYRITRPYSPGCDIAGEVLSVGPGVDLPRLGERVVLYPVESCGTCEWCSAGMENRCASRTVIGAGPRWGGYSQVVVAPARNAVVIPSSLSFEDAASIPVASLTAWHMLKKLGGLKAGQTVLVMGAGGGVGSAAITIARAEGARVLATAGREDKREKALKIGAETCLDHGAPHLSRRILDATGGRGVDLVIENIGPTVFKEAVQALSPGGTLVTCGATSGPEAPLELRYLFSRELTVKGAYTGSFAEFRDVLAAYGSDRLAPVVDSIHPLSEVVRALGRMVSRESFGKLILVH